MTLFCRTRGEPTEMKSAFIGDLIKDRLPYKQKVRGSSPRPPTEKQNHLAVLSAERSPQKQANSGRSGSVSAELEVTSR